MRSALLFLAACGGGSHGHANDALPPDSPPPCNGGALFAIEPGVANSGDTLGLEGAFGADATVVFGGNVQEIANVLGPGRATIVVPDAARTGPLQLCGGGPAPLSFGHPSYPIALGTFSATFDQAQRGERAPQLFAATSSYATAIVGNTLYVIGGASGAGPGTAIERATLRDDGTLGVFTVVANENLSFARSGHTATVIANHLYVIGGGANGSTFDSIDRATIQPDGTLGPFQIDPTLTLHFARANHTSAIIGGYLYVIGGTMSGASSPLDSLERAPIQSDGTLGPFEVVPQTLSLGRGAHGSAVIGNYLYVFGGGDGNQAIDSIDRATIGPDGSLETFALLPAHLTMSRTAFASAVIGRSLYLFGGFAGSGFNTAPSASIERAPILPDGTLDAFVATTATLTTPRWAFQVVTTPNAVYAVSGQGMQSGPPPASCEFASIDSTGDLGAFAVGGNLATPRAGGGVFASSTMLYAFAGSTTNSNAIGTIEQATIDPDGTLGPLATIPGATLAVPRSDFATAVAWGFLYVIGGFAANGTTAELERASIGDDGKLGTFAAYPVASLTAPREGHTAIVIADALYVIGGRDASLSPLGTLERATINPGGSLQPWTQVTGTTLVTPRYGHASALLGNYLYVIGGTDAGGNMLSSIEAVRVYSDNSLGIFTQVGTLTVPRAYARAFVVGDQLYLVGGVSGGAGLATIERATIHADGTLGTFAAVSTTLTTARAAAGVAAAGNFVYLLGGAGDGASTLASVEQAKLQ